MTPVPIERLVNSITLFWIDAGADMLHGDCSFPLDGGCDITG